MLAGPLAVAGEAGAVEAREAVLRRDPDEPFAVLRNGRNGVERQPVALTPDADVELRLRVRRRREERRGQNGGEEGDGGTEPPDLRMKEPQRQGSSSVSVAMKSG